MTREMLLLSWSVAGVAAGALHAGLLLRSARFGHGPGAALGRLLLVAGTLGLAAWGGHVLASAAGWAAALTVRVSLLWRRLP